MKKVILTILAIFYLGLSSEATVHFHYCMGKLVTWGLAKQPGKVCDFCGMPKAESKKKSCCKDVKQQVKVEKTQKVSQTVFKFEQSPLDIIKPDFFVSYQSQVPVKIVREALSNAPPYRQQVPVFIQNCTYRI